MPTRLLTSAVLPPTLLQASISEMIPPGCLVMLTPIVVGVLFGVRTLAGVLAGALVSGVQMAVSMSNTGEYSPGVS